ncbi:MAG: hypothetical protein ACTSR3_05675 [Candidatus Helarchaeota archaeon]
MDFIEEIDRRRTTNFKITKIPVWALKEFKKLCKEEYGDIYFVGIIQLMKIKKHYEELIPILSKLQSQIDSLEKKFVGDKKIKAFGEK